MTPRLVLDAVYLSTLDTRGARKIGKQLTKFWRAREPEVTEWMRARGHDYTQVSHMRVLHVIAVERGHRSWAAWLSKEEELQIGSR